MLRLIGRRGRGQQGWYSSTLDKTYHFPRGQTGLYADFSATRAVQDRSSRLLPMYERINIGWSWKPARVIDQPVRLRRTLRHFVLR